MPPAAADRNVFINCPFDDGYRDLFRGIVFTIIRSGYQPRCALETDDAGEPRFAKIAAIIASSSFGIHDICRVELDGNPPLPRFNMPFELGLFLGAKKFGNRRQNVKTCIVFDTERFRFQRFLSDIAGQDIHAHGGEPDRLIERLAAWLRDKSNDPLVPGGRQIAREFIRFQKLLPNFCARRQIEPDELTFGDLTTLVAAYIATL